MILSKTCVYGIRAVLYIATNTGRRFVPIREISNELNISFHFLTKILQTLSQKGILVSQKGASGGVSLAQAAAEIQLIDVVKAIDGRDIFSECILGMPGCGVSTPCPLHSQWQDLKNRMEDLFSNTSVEGMAEMVTENGLRLSEIDIGPASI